MKHNRTESIRKLKSLLKNEDDLLRQLKESIEEKERVRLLKMGVENPGFMKLSDVMKCIPPPIVLSNAGINEVAHGVVSQLKSDVIDYQDEEIAVLIPAAAKGNKFKPARPKGSLSKKTKYIHKLALSNPGKIAKTLFNEADKKIIGEMNLRTFANHVSKARTTKQ